MSYLQECCAYVTKHHLQISSSERDSGMQQTFHEQKWKYKFSKNRSSRANEPLRLLWRECWTFSTLWLLPLLLQQYYHSLNHFASSLSRPLQRPVVQACHTGQTMHPLMLSGHSEDSTWAKGLGSRHRHKDDRRVALTFRCRSQSRFYRLSWGIHSGQLSGAGDETEDSRGQKEGAYCEGQQNVLVRVLLEVIHHVQHSE